MPLPKQLKAYKKDAELALSEGLVKEIDFSGPTYQILVEDAKTHAECWVFLQLDEQGHFRDAFCSYDETSPENPGCSHIAAAFLSVFDNTGIPIHQRFSSSIWNHLCSLFAQQKGGNPSQLNEVEAGHFVCSSAGGKVVFSIQAKNKKNIKKLEDILFHRTEPTEETSLKFSNMPHEELVLWKQGRPSPQLQYQLSFWYDIARWCFEKQEVNEQYQISFQYSKEELPNWIQADFQGLSIGFYLSQANLPAIVPFLSSVNSPLSVKESGDQVITSITYDKPTGKLHITQNVPEIGKDSKEGIRFSGWRFVPGKGFESEGSQGLLEAGVLEGNKLSNALSSQKELINRFLKEDKIYEKPLKASYQLFFDKQWQLHILSYIKRPGDLSTGYSRLIGDWVYLDGEGFYPLEDKMFQDIETVIPIEKVAEFVTRNRAWLNTMDGFRTHIRAMEYQMGYRLDEENRLHFFRKLEETNEGAALQDFGTWIYVEGRGFFSKTAGTFSFLLRPGASIKADQIPLFIKMNRDELSLINGFFCLTSPIESSHLSVSLYRNKSIQITPEYVLSSRYKGSKIHYFDDVVYVDGEGFYVIPPALKLPEGYQRPIVLEGDQISQFILEGLQTLEPFIKTLDDRLKRPQQLQLQASDISAAEDKGRGWYNLKMTYTTEKGPISISYLKGLIAKKQRFAFTKEGLLDLEDRRFDWLRLLGQNRVDVEKDSLLMTTLEFMRLNAFDPLTLTDDASITSRKLFEQLTNFKTPENPIYGGLKSTLRHYQEIGVAWLWFLYQQQLSGLLCDDMGLGKTHQAMALLASVRNLYATVAESVPCHFLIVCPTSVIHHWEEKLQQFLPGVRVCTFYGTNRNIVEFHQQYDVLITSYGVLRNEQQLLSEVRFEVAVFDEIQVAKNASSRVYEALTMMQANMKLGLTGTPIENNLRELKSLFDIVLPSYMPGEADFREFFIRPIEKGDDPTRKALLTRLIKPFIMRRKKSDVLTELPEKIEEVAHCDLSENQIELYREVLEQRRRHLIQELDDESTPIPFLHIFSLLSSLKQICDHPAVYLKQPEEYHKYRSGKWELFLELLMEARESGQKVVVFSHFLHMLDIIEMELTRQQINFASIRGVTKDRKEQIHKFNNDPNCEVFVGSLQAAGLGVDLTAGSVVIHYDRWWNKAREDQATDRVHRMGQKRGVQVFKLVTKGTFEESIDAMITRKGKLMEDVVGVDDQSIMKKFTRAELRELLNFTGKDLKNQQQ